MEFRENQAIYLQIADLFCENILLKKWNTDEKIPSVREIAVEVEVNPNTAMRTYTYLQDKGIIYNKRGIGFFVSEDGFDKSLELKKEKFYNQELPLFFKTIELLGISLEEISKLYINQNKNVNNEN
jgi:GntR family transcriptional regulator